MNVLLELDWNATAVVIAILVTALGAVVGAFVWALNIFNARIHEKLEQAAREAQARDAAIEAKLERLTSQIGALGEIEHGWNYFVECLGECIVSLANRQEWHAGLISRALAPGDEAPDEKAAMHGDAELKTELTPRMHELFLFQNSRKVRADAARTLADGVGDHKTVARMQALASIDEKLKKPLDRLLRRLGDNAKSASNGPVASAGE